MKFEAFKKKYEKVPVREYPNKVLDAIPHPIVSCRVITYQHAEFIEDCIRGLLMQETSFPFEILIGEDGSTDGTREICIKYAEQFPELIRLFLNDKRNNIPEGGSKNGRFNARYSTYLSRGEYMAFCEGDDYWTDPLKLQKQIDIMREYPECYLSFHPVNILYNNGISAIHQRHCTHNKVFPVEDIIRRGGDFCPTVSIIIKSESINIYEWTLLFPAGDYYFQIISSMNGGALYIDEIMAVYRKRVPGSWSDKHSSFKDLCRHSLKMIKTNRLFDKKTYFKYHASFKDRERFLLKKHSVFRLYNYDSRTIRAVKLIIRNETSGTIKLKAYFYLILSFCYYRLNFRKLFQMKNRLNEVFK